MNHLTRLHHQRSPRFFGKDKRTNNRKRTKGRKNERHATGGFRGYVPNHIRHNYKMLEKCMNKLEQLNALPPIEKLQPENMKKIAHFEYLVRKYEQRIQTHNPNF